MRIVDDQVVDRNPDPNARGEHDSGITWSGLVPMMSDPERRVAHPEDG